jgi:hypothetical protein
MPDEKVGTPGADTPVPTGTAPNPNAGDAHGSGGSPETPPADPRYAGKSAAELVEIIREKDAMVGKLGERLGRMDALESEIGGLRDYVLRQGREREERPPANTPGPSADWEFDVTNPSTSIDRRMEQREQALVNRFGQMRQKEMYDEAVSNFNDGRAEAYARNPELFDGCQKEVEALVWGTVQQNPANRFGLRSPSTWENAATIYWATQKKFDKLTPKQKPVMAPPPGELPGRTARPLPDDDEVTLTDDELQQAFNEGWDEKEALEAKKTGLEMVRRGQAIGRVIGARR